MDWATVQGFRNVLAGNMTLPLPNPCSGIQVALPRQPKDGQHAALAYHELPDFILKLRESSASTAEGCKQRSRSMPFVIMSASFGLPGLHRQHWRGAIQRLNLRFFVDAQDHSMLRRVDIEANKPRQIGDKEIEDVVIRTLERTPRGATHWSTRSMAKATGYSHMTISRVWRAFGLQPHRSETFKLSSDPLLIENVRDVAPERGSSSNPATRWATKRDRHFHTVVVDTRSRCATFTLSKPSAQANTTRVRRLSCLSAS